MPCWSSNNPTSPISCKKKSSLKAVGFSSSLSDCSLNLDDVECCGTNCIELSGVEEVVFCEFSAVAL